MSATDRPYSSFSASLAPPVRYDPVAQFLHWLTAALVITILPIAWHMTALARDNPQRESWYTVHKSIGLTILVLSVVRLIWRGLHPPPPFSGLMGRLEEAVAVVSHWLLYVILFAMPISGYLISAAGGHAVNYFGLFEIPNIVPQSKELAKLGDQIHVAGQWAVYALVSLHLLATVWHVTVPKDGVLERMLPKQTDWPER